MPFAPSNSRTRSYRSLPGESVIGTFGPASLTTNLTGTNNDLTYTSKAASKAANDVTVAYVVAGNSTALSVSVSGSAVTVNVATDSSGVATSTASQVLAAVNGSVEASALVSAALATGNSGAGVVTALSATNLSGGTSYIQGRPGSGFSSRRASRLS